MQEIEGSVAFWTTTDHSSIWCSAWFIEGAFILHVIVSENARVKLACLDAPWQTNIWVCSLSGYCGPDHEVPVSSIPITGTSVTVEVGFLINLATTQISCLGNMLGPLLTCFIQNKPQLQVVVCGNVWGTKKQLFLGGRKSTSAGFHCHSETQCVSWLSTHLFLCWVYPYSFTWHRHKQCILLIRYAWQAGVAPKHGIKQNKLRF